MLSEATKGSEVKSRFSGKKIIIGVIVILVIAGAVWFSKSKKPARVRRIKPFVGSISVKVRVTGSVQPRNRLEVKPQVPGRIEDILVVEGQKIKKGEIIAWTSSTDRAALLDAARSKSEDEVKKWEDTYKPTPIISPLGGFIIARNKEPGQTVSASDVILVMADKLIITAAVDETDLRYIKLNQRVKIILDAYPDSGFAGSVEHIAYESKLISNVTVYEIKILPQEVPENFRAGMTATVELIAQQKNDILLLPSDAIQENKNGKFVEIMQDKSKTIMKKIESGISDGKNTEIISGLTEEDTVVLTSGGSQKSGSAPGSRSGNPFGGGGRMH